MAAWIPAAITGAATLMSGLFGSKSQNKNIDKQIAAQSKENALTREHNLNLAKQQNQWNIDQWNRENQYNDPAQQMARYRDAGLNPNLIYGQSNTAPQLSGSLTSGAPSTPTDMSALGNKKSSVSSVFDAIKENPFMYEQLRGMRLDNDKKEGDLTRQNLDNAFNEWLKTTDPYTNSESPFAKSIEGRRAWMDLQNAMSENNLKDIQLSLSTFQHQMNQKTADYLIRKLAAETEMTETEAKNFATEVFYELGILKADNRIKISESLLHNPEFMKKLDNSGWHWATTFANFLKSIINPFK